MYICSVRPPKSPLPSRRPLTCISNLCLHSCLIHTNNFFEHCSQAEDAASWDSELGHLTKYPHSAYYYPDPKSPGAAGPTSIGQEKYLRSCFFDWFGSSCVNGHRSSTAVVTFAGRFVPGVPTMNEPIYVARTLTLLRSSSGTLLNILHS